MHKGSRVGALGYFIRVVLIFLLAQLDAVYDFTYYIGLLFEGAKQYLKE